MKTVYYRRSCAVFGSERHTSLFEKRHSRYHVPYTARTLLAVAAALAFVSPCNAYRRKTISVPQGQVEMTGSDYCGDSTGNLIRLDQGWSDSDREWFYWTSQGSRLLPYAFFLALEQVNDTTLFRDPQNLLKYRFLPVRPTPANPDGLPIGFVPDPQSGLPPEMISDRRSVGLTCAACHTSNINYKGTGIRIDGAAALPDVGRFLIDLTAALKATADDDEKFARFARTVLGSAASGGQKTTLRSALRNVADQRAAYDELNHSDVAGGFGRLDAFGRIFNNALVLVDPQNGMKAEAPVRFPQLWDTTRLDYVQWTGVSSNSGIGPTMRNLGQMVGVFAEIDPGDPPPAVGFGSSVDFGNIRALQGRLKRLKSPQWPENILPHISSEQAAAGRQIFMNKCVGCHHDIDRNGKDHVQTTRVNISTVRTDPVAAENLMNPRGSTGFLAGTKQDVYFGKPFGPTDTAFHIVRSTTLHMLFGKLSPRLRNKTMRRAEVLDADPAAAKDREAIEGNSKHEPALRYKARPLNGIWAVAPYLHNGSVPNLYEMLLPAEQRSRQFAVGRREFDPVKVGFVGDPAEGTFLFDTTAKGNNNGGHEFAASLSETDRWRLLEYLKSL